MVYMSGTSSVCLVYLVDLVCLVSFIQPNKRNRPNKPNNGPLTLADCFSILLAANKGDEFLVDQVWSFPLWDVSCLGDSDES
jgi:hypothetical protein